MTSRCPVIWYTIKLLLGICQVGYLIGDMGRVVDSCMGGRELESSQQSPCLLLSYIWHYEQDGLVTSRGMHETVMSLHDIGTRSTLVGVIFYRWMSDDMIYNNTPAKTWLHAWLSWSTRVYSSRYIIYSLVIYIL